MKDQPQMPLDSFVCAFKKRPFGLLIHTRSIDILATTWDFQQCGMCDQQSLRSVCAYAHWLFYECKATDWISLGVSKLNRRLHRLVWVNSCQNATLLENACPGSIIYTCAQSRVDPLHSRFELLQFTVFSETKYILLSIVCLIWSQILVNQTN